MGGFLGNGRINVGLGSDVQQKEVVRGEGERDVPGMRWGHGSEREGWMPRVCACR
jgi:hypothetical protein